MIYSLDQIIKVMQNKKYIIYDELYVPNLVGIRNDTVTGNMFDDMLYAFWNVQDGSTVFKQWKITTDPGNRSLLQPINQRGCAILKEGQYKNSHAIGMHRGKYKALVQVNNVTVYRDNDRDKILDFDKSNVDTGLFGINIHRATENGTSIYVENWSAGCQVFANSKEYKEFIDTMDALSKKTANKYFTYTLLLKSDFANLSNTDINIS